MADDYKNVKLSPIQQMVASCSGAFMVSLLCKCIIIVRTTLPISCQIYGLYARSGFDTDLIRAKQKYENRKRFISGGGEFLLSSRFE